MHGAGALFRQRQHSVSTAESMWDAHVRCFVTDCTPDDLQGMPEFPHPVSLNAKRQMFAIGLSNITHQDDASYKHGKQLNVTSATASLFRHPEYHVLIIWSGAGQVSAAATFGPCVSSDSLTHAAIVVPVPALEGLTPLAVAINSGLPIRGIVRAGGQGACASVLESCCEDCRIIR